MTQPGSGKTSLLYLVTAAVAMGVFFLLWAAFAVALIIAFVIAVVAGAVISVMMRQSFARAARDRQGDVVDGSARDVSEPAAPPAAAPIASQPEEPAAPAEEPAAEGDRSELLIKPSKELPGQQELAARKGTWRYEREG